MSQATPQDLHDLTLAEAGARLAAGQTTSEALTRHALARIEQHAQLGAFLHVDTDGALADARAADAR
ncbi:MAG TPA: hypothetical protein H9903_07255, partial [Candidatus Aquabacterium excrementipullorum]|nr:hypothetical protein [Candidatus Aquabacterium excrementipullorum]